MLQADAPMQLAGRAAGVSIDVDKRRLWRPYARGDLRGIMGTEVRPKDWGIAKAVADGIRVSVGQGTGSQSVSGRAEGIEVRNAVGKKSVVDRKSTRLNSSHSQI